MYRRSPLPGGNGEAAFEIDWRSGESGLYGGIRYYFLLGQISLGLMSAQEYDLRNTQSIEESVRHSDAVYNLVGRRYPTKCVIPLGLSMTLENLCELIRVA